MTSQVSKHLGVTIINSKCWAWSTHVVVSEDSQMEGQQLQRDDAQDALETVHTARHFDGAAAVLDGLVIVFVTDHDRTALWITSKTI